jgi:hypothetical protein
MSSSTMPGGLSVVRKRLPIARLSIPWILATPKLTAKCGWILFACALVAMFRIMALNANHELHYPGLDFAICSVVATLGLGTARTAPASESRPTPKSPAHRTEDWTAPR